MTRVGSWKHWNVLTFNFARLGFFVSGRELRQLSHDLAFMMQMRVSGGNVCGGKIFKVSKFWHEKQFAIVGSFWNKIKLFSAKILSLKSSLNLNYFLQKFLINKSNFPKFLPAFHSLDHFTLSIDNQNQKRSINNPASNPLIIKLLTAFQSPRLRCDLFWHKMLISLWQDKSKDFESWSPAAINPPTQHWAPSSR